MIFKRKHKEEITKPVFRNTLRSPEVEKPASDPIPSASNEKPDSKDKPVSVPGLGILQLVLDGSILTRESFMRILPFGIFIGFLGLVYIGNSYYAIRQIRMIDTLTIEMKELQYEYITTKSSLMYHSKPSELARKLETTGIKESTKPPDKVFIKQQQ